MANWRNRTNKHSITDINWSKGQNRLVRELKVERAPFFFKIAPSKVIPPPYTVTMNCARLRFCLLPFG
jgi:hypothetical protein